MQGNTITENNSGLVLGSGANNNLIGGTAAGAGNVLSGNLKDGLIIAGPDNVVQGNTIVDNLDNGVEVSADDNLIGGGVAASNLISGNGSNGVVISRNGTGNAILGNAIFNNGELGIDLSSSSFPDGVTPNDDKDEDTGGNNLQNFPLIDAVTCLAIPFCMTNGSVIVQGSLNSTPNTEFTIILFSNAQCDTSGHGEGERAFHFFTVETNDAGNASFTEVVTDKSILGQYVTATATDPGGSTSEFSPCAFVPLAVFIEVDPADPDNVISVGNEEIVPVIIISTSPVFSPTQQLDYESLGFGKTGGEESLLFIERCVGPICFDIPVCIPIDIPQVSILVCLFESQEMGFSPGDTKGFLGGKTKDGFPILGLQQVSIVP